ncbi:MAG: DUF4153 domain-containing protein [Lachnospiraceae bacterium]|nr:DUF4153 domain-containing protein [Lachnospiraceae bacterium]
MGKLGIAIDRQKESIKGIIKRYLITLICVNAACIFEIFLDATGYYTKSSGMGSLWGNGSVRDMVDYILGFLVLFAVGSFFVESVFTEDGSNRKKLVLPYILLGIISVVLDVLSWNADDIFSKMGQDMLLKTVWLYIILCTVLGFHKLIKSSGMSFAKYAVNLLVGAIKVGTVLFLLNVGFVLLVTIFDILILDIKEWDFIEYVELFLVGAVYVPYTLICLTDKTETESKFIRSLLLWVLMPMVNAAMIIIYMYVLKIVVTGYMPKNEVFGICAGLFCCGVVIWTMAYPFVPDEYKDSKGKALYRNVIKYAKYIYAPFILLECYCIGIRINEYGITVERYFAVVFIICQIIYVAWEPLYGLVRKMLKKEKNGYAEGYENLLYVGIAVYVLCVMLPFFSAEKVEFLSQKKRFEAIMNGYSVDELNLAKDDLRSASSTYRVIMWNIYGDEYLRETYTTDERKKLSTYFKTADVSEKWNYYKSTTKDAISVSGYSYMYSFTKSLPSHEEYNIDNTMPVSINIQDLQNGEEVWEVDVWELVQLVIRRGSNSDYNDGTLPYEIQMDGGKKCVVSYISFSYNETDGTIKYLDLKGYILW